MLDAYAHARYRILKVRTLAPGAGFHCEDLLHRREALFVMDIGFSQNGLVGLVMAARTICLGEYWMTIGAPLPIASTKLIEDFQRQFRKRAAAKPLAPAWDISLAMVRACLDGGGASQVEYR